MAGSPIQRMPTPPRPPSPKAGDAEWPPFANRIVPPVMDAIYVALIEKKPHMAARGVNDLLDVILTVRRDPKLLAPIAAKKFSDAELNKLQLQYEVSVGKRPALQPPRIMGPRPRNAVNAAALKNEDIGGVAAFLHGVIPTEIDEFVTEPLDDAVTSTLNQMDETDMAGVFAEMNSNAAISGLLAELGMTDVKSIFSVAAANPEASAVARSLGLDVTLPFSSANVAQAHAKLDSRLGARQV